MRVGKTLRGVKRTARQTFRKLFGGSKIKQTNKFKNSTKFITDKMLESSDSETSFTAIEVVKDSGYCKLE